MNKITPKNFKNSLSPQSSLAGWVIPQKHAEMTVKPREQDTVQLSFRLRAFPHAFSCEPVRARQKWWPKLICLTLGRLAVGLLSWCAWFILFGSCPACSLYTWWGHQLYCKLQSWTTLVWIVNTTCLGSPWRWFIIAMLMVDCWDTQ